MVRPRDLVWSTLLIVLSSILILISSHWAFNLCLDPIIISSVLATFKLNLLALSQQVRLLSSEVTASLRPATVFVSFPQKRNGIVFSSGVNYLHSGGNIQSE